MKRPGTHLPRDTVARWIALTTLIAMLTLLALNQLFSLLAGAWARPPLMETGLMEKAAAITRIIDSVAPNNDPILPGLPATRHSTRNGCIGMKTPGCR